MRAGIKNPVGCEEFTGNGEVFIGSRILIMRCEWFTISAYFRSLSDLSNRSEPSGRTSAYFLYFEAYSRSMQREIEEI